MIVPADGINVIMDKLKDYLSLWTFLQTLFFYKAAMQNDDFTIFPEECCWVNGFVLLKCFLCTFRRQTGGTTKNIHQINIFKYCILLYFGVIIKQSIKTQYYKKTWISAQYVFNQN